jgi:hypothetical protein
MAPSWLGSASWIFRAALRDEVQARREFARGGVQILRAAGHDAVTVLGQGWAESPTQRYPWSFKRRVVRLSLLDVGFGNIRTYSPGSGAQGIGCGANQRGGGQTGQPDRLTSGRDDGILSVIIEVLWHAR